MTGRDYLFKWGVYGAALLLLLLLECALLTRIPLAGVCPMLFPLAVVAVAVFESPEAGAGFGLGTGILHGAFCYGDGSFLTVCLVLVGLLAGLIARRFLSRGFITYLFCSLGGMMILDGVRILLRLSGDSGAVGAMFRISTLEIAYSFLFAVPIYFLFRAVFRRVGGTVLG